MMPGLQNNLISMVFRRLFSAQACATIWLAFIATGFFVAPIRAETIANPVVVFAGLDKITGRIINFDVYIDETVQFGALQITPKACHTRPPNETQRTTVFVEVEQVLSLIHI